MNEFIKRKIVIHIKLLFYSKNTSFIDNSSFYSANLSGKIDQELKTNEWYSPALGEMRKKVNDDKENESPSIL